MSMKCERRSLAAFALVLATGNALAEENASNPLASVNNVDLRVQFFDLERGSERLDFFVDGPTCSLPS